MFKSSEVVNTVFLLYAAVMGDIIVVVINALVGYAVIFVFIGLHGRISGFRLHHIRLIFIALLHEVLVVLLVVVLIGSAKLYAGIDIRVDVKIRTRLLALGHALLHEVLKGAGRIVRIIISDVRVVADIIVEIINPFIIHSVINSRCGTDTQRAG